MRQLPSGEWWSDISPWVQRLSRRNILATADASLAWDKLSASSSSSSSSPTSVLPFAIHLWIAGSEGTVCKWDGVDGVLDMKRRLPGDKIDSKPPIHTHIHTYHSVQPRLEELFFWALSSALPKVVERSGIYL